MIVKRKGLILANSKALGANPILMNRVGFLVMVLALVVEAGTKSILLRWLYPMSISMLST